MSTDSSVTSCRGGYSEKCWILDYLHLQGEVGLAQEDALAHDAAVLHTDLQVRAVQPPVGVLHPAGMENI